MLKIIKAIVPVATGTALLGCWLAYCSISASIPFIQLLGLYSPVLVVLGIAWLISFVYIALSFVLGSLLKE